VNAPVVAPPSVQVRPDVVHLAWTEAAFAGLRVTVYRRTPDRDWSPLGVVVAGSDGRLAYDDRQVALGTTYGYRLGVSALGCEDFSDATWVGVPGELRLELVGVRPNPSRAGMTAEFTLPGAGPAHLELIDLLGRRVVTRELNTLGRGTHLVDLAEAGHLAPGVYLLRLTRGKESVTTRAVIVR